MQERHPIDDRFRQLLAKAEADPPAAVWEQLAARQQRKRRAAWWPWRTLALLLGGTALVGGAAWWTLASTDQDRYAEGPQRIPATTTASVSAPATPEPTAVTTAPANTPASAESNAPDAPTVTYTNSPARASSTPGRNTNAPTSKSTRASDNSAGARENTGTPQRSIAPADKAAMTIDAQIRAAAHTAPAPLSPTTTATGMEQRTPAHERMGTVLRTTLAPGTPAQRTTPHYRVPPGEWWLAVHVGSTSSRSTWYGDDRALGDALNEAEGWQQQVTWGGALGRQWRSGFGLSVGLMTERSERGFRHVDRTVYQDQSIESYFVTLNGQVFVSDVDTIITTTAVETVTQGVDRRSTVRIPVLAHWQQEWRRWSLGVRVGPTVEFTQAEAGPGIVRRSADQLGAGTLSASQRQERYPAAVLGLTGLDLGWRLHEHWTIQAGYLALWPISAVQPRSTVYATTLRHGAELRLILHLPSRP